VREADLHRHIWQYTCDILWYVQNHPIMRFCKRYLTHSFDSVRIPSCGQCHRSNCSRGPEIEDSICLLFCCGTPTGPVPSFVYVCCYPWAGKQSLFLLRKYVYIYGVARVTLELLRMLSDRNLNPPGYASIASQASKEGIKCPTTRGIRGY
jgi:hypothetical protein